MVGARDGGEALIGRGKKEADKPHGSVVDTLGNIAYLRTFSIPRKARKCSGRMAFVWSGYHRSKDSMGSPQQDVVLADDCYDWPCTRRGHHYGAVDFKMDTGIHNLSVLCFGWYGDPWNSAAHGEDEFHSDLKFIAPSNAPQHGMQDGSDDVGENPYYMQQLAHQAADGFISQQLASAQQAQADWEAQGHSGISLAAITAFGNAPTYGSGQDFSCT